VTEKSSDRVQSPMSFEELAQFYNFEVLLHYKIRSRKTTVLLKGVKLDLLLKEYGRQLSFTEVIGKKYEDFLAKQGLSVSEVHEKMKGGVYKFFLLGGAVIWDVSSNTEKSNVIDFAKWKATRRTR